MGGEEHAGANVTDDDYSDLPLEGGRVWTERDRRRIWLAAAGTVVLLGLVWFEAFRGGDEGPSSAGPVADWPESTQARDDVPRDLLGVYEQAATTCPGLPWPVIAAIGKAESDHGRAPSTTSPAGAEGPMQFLPATWADYQADGDGDGDADIEDPEDAIYGAARLLCANGGESPAGLRRAIFAYNRSDSYVDRVLEIARGYTDAELQAA